MKRRLNEKCIVGTLLYVTMFECLYISKGFLNTYLISQVALIL